MPRILKSLLWGASSVALVTFLTAIPSSGLRAVGQPVTLPRIEAPATDWPWESEIRAFEAADKLDPPPQGGIVFVGASGIRMWKTLQQDFPDCPVLNRGFGGSHMADSVHFADRIVIPYKPRLIVIQAGGNDIHAGLTPEQVLADFKAFVEKVHAALPTTRIAFLSLNPSPSRWSQATKQKETNRLVKEYIASRPDLAYINFWDPLIGSDGKPRYELFIGDRLHNNADGYKLRTQIVKSTLARLSAYP